MARATKLLVVAWVLVALAVKLWLLRSAWPGLPLAVGLLTVMAAALAAIDRRTVSLVLVFSYLYPAIIRVVHGFYHVDYTVVWLGPLVGAMLPDALRSPWRLPAGWRRALIYWALIVAIAVPLVIFREMDFYPALFAKGSGPGFTARWELHVGLLVLIGILWFDWLFGLTQSDFTTWVGLPLAVSAAIMSVVALYQGFVNVGFLNETPYGVMGRASGTLFDGNVCGALAAIWIGAGVVLAERLGRLWMPMALAGIALCWTTVYVTGSRTAFMAAALVTVFTATAPWKGRVWPGWRRVFIALAAATAIVVLIARLPVASSRIHITGPVARILDTLPSASSSSVRAFVVEMWNRGGYGESAMAMIREHPLVGVGVGSFYTLAHDFSRRYDIPPDNAQNWYRHLFAELGLIGSLGWIAWTLSFARFLFRRRPGAPPALWVLRGSLLAFGLVSLVGVPGQVAPVVLTFWTLAYWFMAMAGAPASPGDRVSESSGRRVSLQATAMATLVALFAIGTIRAGATTLRPVALAHRFGHFYSYGFHQVEPGPGSGGEQRWTEQRAVRTIEVKGPWLALSVNVNHADLATRPVDARVWEDGTLIIDAHLTNADPVTKYVHVHPGERWVMIETWVNRVLKPRDFGVADDRELGLLVWWKFVASPPPGEAGGPALGRIQP